MKWVLRQLQKDLWSPEVAGVGLGLVYILAIWLSNHTPGVSGTFFNFAAIIGRPMTTSDPANQFFVSIFPPITQGLNWQFWMVAGMFIGALASVVIGGHFKITLMPVEQWRDVFGGAVWKRWVIAFVGGIILEIGAGIAGGCTSGLALGGGVQLSPAAFLFIPAIFISGALVQLLVYRNRY
jgi:uncharacterized protein